MNRYHESLVAAGAVVLEFEEFGSYQGDWLAVVDYNGERGLVWGSYGSCDHCDAFEGEFGWDAADAPDYLERLAEFGKTYLNAPLYYTPELYKHFEKQAEWDGEAQDVVEFLRKVDVLYGV